MASKTKENIVQAYLELLEENEFDKVTVTDLVESCSISRQTFYYHFDGIEDMIKWSFDNEIEKAVKASKDCTTWMSAFKKLVPMLEKHSIIIKVSKNSTKLLYIQQLIASSVYHFTVSFYLDVLHYDGERGKRQDFLVKYSSAAILGLIYMEMIYDEEFSYEKLFEEVEKTFKQNK